MRAFKMAVIKIPPNYFIEVNSCVGEVTWLLATSEIVFISQNNIGNNCNILLKNGDLFQVKESLKEVEKLMWSHG